MKEAWHMEEHDAMDVELECVGFTLQFDVITIVQRKYNICLCSAIHWKSCVQPNLKRKL